MKKLISLTFAILFVACSFSACSDKTGGTQDYGSVTQSRISIEQAKILASFGITLEKDRIVGYRETDDYLEYVVIKYNGDAKTNEKNYYIYYNEEVYEKSKELYANANGVEYKDDAITVVVNSSKANTGLYSKDLEIIEKAYKLRTNL